jgi:RNA polymerase sigma factor (sigma-70 family)
MHQTISDNELWEDFRKGQTYALSHIYHVYIDRLYRYGKKFSNDDELVKDIIQDLFFDLLRRRAHLGTTDNIYFYLIKALRRRISLYYSGEGKLKQSYQSSEMPPANIVYSIEEDYIEKEDLSLREEMIRKALAALSPKQREVLYYRFTCEFEYDQICEMMSIKYDSARKMVFRALKTLREQLAETNILLFYLQSVVMEQCHSCKS